MALWNGLDTVAILSRGIYTETYGAAEPANIANLAASWGYLEDAPSSGAARKLIGKIMMGMAMIMGG